MFNDDVKAPREGLYGEYSQKEVNLNVLNILCILGSWYIAFHSLVLSGLFVDKCLISQTKTERITVKII